jgi:hypothetical protein
VRVALVTTWGTACGIAEHSAFLKQAVEDADPEIDIRVITDLHPKGILGLATPSLTPPFDLVVLNYHAALHSQWTPDAIRQVQEQHKIPVMVIYHDTGVPCNDQCLGIVTAADATVVHEPCDEFRGNPNVHYWRMGVPGWAGVWRHDFAGPRPILGSIGFPFPWKNYDQLARITAEIGWGLLLLAPGATVEQVERWRVINPYLDVQTAFTNARQAVSMLAGCDATAFAYTCQNAGQSAAILMGIAARKPVLAFAQCRQFRALFDDRVGRTAISWVENSFLDLGFILQQFVRIERVSPAIVALAEQESWAKLGVKFADLWQAMVVRDLPEPAA